MRKALIAVVCALGLVALTATKAAAIDITLTFTDAYYVGQIVDGIPSSVADEMGYISDLITLAPGAPPTAIPPSTETYNRLNSTNNGPFPDPNTLIGTKFDMRDGWPTSLISVNGVTYILAKYDAHNPGAGAYVWLLTGLLPVDTVTLPTLSPGGYGISHYTVFGAVPTVPDGGATLMMLGGALVGLGALRRRFSA